MSLAVSDLDERWQQPVLDYLRRAPYRNALPLSNVTQLRHACEVVVAHRNGKVQGMASYYRDLPFANLSFVAELGEPLPTLLAALAARVPALGNTSLVAVLPEHRMRQLAGCATLESAELEWQMVVEPETLQPRDLGAVRRLTTDDAPEMNALAGLCGLVAWRAEVLSHGPAFGAFVEGQLAAMATTHFATTDVIEIGNIATHPVYRRRGLASACTVALTQACFGLAPRVYLMVMDENRAAYDSYRKLGFFPKERFAFVQFCLM